MKRVASWPCSKDSTSTASLLSTASGKPHEARSERKLRFEEVQVGALDVEARLGGDGVRELLHRRREVEPPEARDRVEKLADRPHDAEVQLDLLRHVGMPHLPQIRMHPNCGQPQH